MDKDSGLPAGKKKNAAKNATKKAAPAPTPAIAPNVKFESSKLTIAKTALTVETWILPDGKDGVIAQHGGGRFGYALALQPGRPGFSVRTSDGVVTAEAQRALDAGWNHLAAVLTDSGVMRLYVNGEPAAEAKANGQITEEPRLGLVLGTAGSSVVAPFGKNAPYTGMIDQFAVFGRALAPGEIIDHANSAEAIKSAKGAMLVATFDNGNARDESGNGANGALSGVETGKGKIAAALWFQKGSAAGSVIAGKGADAKASNANKAGGSFVQHNWAHPVPIITRAMAMAGKTIFIAGPPDNIDEEYAFERMAQKDPAILEHLAEQDAALDGKRGASMWAVSTENGKTASELKLPSPPVWDGMAVGDGRLYVATVDGKVLCFGK